MSFALPESYACLCRRAGRQDGGRPHIRKQIAENSRRSRLEPAAGTFTPPFSPPIRFAATMRQRYRASGMIVWQKRHR